jgi:NADPH2:quinone reductase
VGVITELGTGVLNHQIGQRVGYVNPPDKGAFSETSILPTNCLIPLPSNIADEEAAALLFPGLTAWMTLKKLKPLRRGDAVLVRNVTSGLGSIIAQWAKHSQAFVIGTVSSKDRVEHAKNNGCHEVLVNRDEASSQCGFADEVRELTSGEGVDVAFDLIGNNTFMASLDCLAPKGMLVSLGAKGGDAPVLNLNDLAGKTSVVVAFPVLADYVKRKVDLLEGAQLLFELYKAGDLKVEIAKKVALNMISKELDEMVEVEFQGSGSCILIPPIPTPEHYYSSK